MMVNKACCSLLFMAWHAPTQRQSCFEEQRSVGLMYGCYALLPPGMHTRRAELPGCADAQLHSQSSAWLHARGGLSIHIQVCTFAEVYNSTSLSMNE